MKPTAKVTAGALGGALSIIAVWFIHTLANVDVPPEVASAVTTVVTFGAGWITHEDV